MSKNGDGVLSRSEFAHLLRHGSAGCAQHEALRMYCKLLDERNAPVAARPSTDALGAEIIRLRGYLEQVRDTANDMGQMTIHELAKAGLR